MLLPGIAWGPAPPAAVVADFRGKKAAQEVAEYPKRGLSRNFVTWPPARIEERFREEVPEENFRLNHGRSCVGKGEKAFRAVSRGLENGDLFQFSWCKFFMPKLDRSRNAGTTALVVAQSPVPLFWILMSSTVLFVDRVSSIAL